MTPAPVRRSRLLLQNNLMSTEIAAPVQMVNVQIDGVWLQFPKGTRVIEACSQASKFIPRYC